MINPMQIMQMIRGGNPQQIVNQMFGNKDEVKKKLKEVGGNNPSIPTLIEAIENNDLKTFQNTARNLYSSQGKDINQILSMFNMK